MKLHTYGDINKNLVEKAIKKTVKELGIIENLEIFVFDDLGHCEKLSKNLPKNIGQRFQEICFTEETSLSLSAENYHRLIIHITDSEEYLKKDFNAFLGVLMHEYMHTILRLKGLDEEIEADAIQSFREFQASNLIFKSRRFKKRYLLEMYSDVGRNATFSLLDFYVNMELINRGLGKYILADYSRLYRKKKTHIRSMPILQLENEPKDSAMGMSYLLNLMSALVPFGRYALLNKNKKAHELANFIEEYYLPKANIIGKLAEPLINYCVDKFAWNSRFRKNYYKKVFQLTLHLLRVR